MVWHYLAAWIVTIGVLLPGEGQAAQISCNGTQYDDNKYICCDDAPHRKSWGRATQCCGLFAYNPRLETCCDGLVNQGFGTTNSAGQCCGSVSYDRRCFECDHGTIVPMFDFRVEICCDGKVQELTQHKTCCCGDKSFDPSKRICCEGKIQSRPDDFPGDCCSCGLTMVDIVVILDSSESIHIDNWPKMLSFTQAILKEAEIDNDNVRVGLVTYRHNVTDEFYLDSYHNKKEMFDVISEMRYVRGSTNTGMALEMVRNHMFDIRRGDRPNVANVVIVITDGDSDDYTYTIEQAKAARDEGIHIFAIGINLKNLTELNNIASPPVENNVLSIDNFEDLEQLQGNLFASICTGSPTILVHLPCGDDDYYHPVFEVCCNGKPQDKVAGDQTKCCGQVSYNKAIDVCCAGQLNEIKYGEDTTCCGVTAMHRVKELCCDDKPVPRASEEDDTCCGAYSYNPSKEVCCEGFVSKGYGDTKRDTACCGDFSYDKRCWECNDGKVNPLFDPTCQICCDGVIHNMTLGLSCCCGKEIFKPETQICCDGELRNRKGDEKKHTCCECGSALVDIGIVMDSSESIGDTNWELLKVFLEDIVLASDIDMGSTRFGLVTYRHNVTLEFYLNTFFRSVTMVDYIKNLRYVRGSTNTGAGIEVMWHDIFRSENGDRSNVPDIALVITDGQSDDPDYTYTQAQTAKENGIHVYVIGVGIEITQELKDIASEPWEDNVFVSQNFQGLKQLKTKLFDVISDVCPQEPREKPKEACGEENMYDPRTELCCDGEPQPMLDTAKTTECCGKKSYNINSHMCCQGKVDVRTSKQDLCCQDVSYNPKNAKCCHNSTVIPTQNGATECCGMETYNPKLELCCDDILYQNYGPGGCCGECCELKATNTSKAKTVSFDNRCYTCVDGELVPNYDCAFQRCCDGVIQEVTSPSSCCCGSIAFDPVDKICCDKKLSKRPKDDDSLCCECPKNLIDIGIILDSSESVGLENWGRSLEFVEDFIGEASLPSVRFGLVVYRHNVSLEFYLNGYHTTEQYRQAVEGMRYVRGSTNTGAALEAMRTQIFDSAHGDRYNAPNFALLVTDGDSDDYSYTVKQAELARRQGIYIVAVGIGLQNMTELRAVASEPIDENAISVENFSELKAVRERIFQEIAGNVCPQMPKDRCRTPCGNTTMDEKMEICCHGVPNRKVAGDRTKCCGTVAYDPDCMICCEGVLMSRHAGEYTECCCHSTYDRRTQLCCGNQVVPKIGGNDARCCHNNSYDRRNQVCCGGIFVADSYGEDNTKCCGQTSYDTRCYKCNRNKTVGPSFDPDTELCCDGNMGPREFGKKSCCCGTKQFDADESVCCNDNLIKRPEPKKRGKKLKPAPEMTCCGNDIHDPLKQICCNGKVQKRVGGLSSMCCGQKAFDPKKTVCCEGKISKRDKNDTCCCDQEVFDVDREICCQGAVVPMVQSGNRKSTVCCGQKGFSPDTELCCDDNVNPLFEGKVNTICCGKKAFNADTHTCENNKIIPLGPKCGGRNYNQDKQICCNNYINNRTAGEPNIRCCDGQAYDIRKQVCCCNGFLTEAVAGKYTQCCYSFGYDSRTHICCDGQVVPKSYPTAECCCGRQSYDSEREICCGGKVRPKCGLITQCCGENEFDPELKICCNGILSDRTYGKATYCCGDVAYTPSMAVCCGDRIAYMKDISMDW